MKILALDIETSGAVVRTFSLFKPFLSIDSILEHPRIICWSAQWHGQRKVMFSSEHHDGRDAMLRSLHELLDEADSVVTYNGKSFDIPWIEGEFIEAGFMPPSPTEHIDLYRVIKARTKHISGKLDYAVQRLLHERKIPHQGIGLWNDCMNGDKKAWDLMKKYSIKDTALLIPLYEKLRPWIPNHPNVAIYNNLDFACTSCGSQSLVRQGYRITTAGKFPQYQCKDCGRWMRDKTRVSSTELRG